MPAREPAPITLRLFSSLSIQRSVVPDALGITKSCWGILACICIGSFLRIYQFWLPDLWLDEYGTWWVVSASTWSKVAERAIRTQGQSPLYYLVVNLFTGIFGEEVLQLRLPSVVFGILTLFVAFRLATRIFRDQEFVLVAVAVFSLNEQLIWFAQNARPYALALFLTLLSFNFFLHFLQLRTAWGGALYILTTALLIYSHFLFGFVLIIQVVFLALKSGSRQVFSKDWLTCFFSMALLCLPLAAQLWSLYGRRQTLNWIPKFELTLVASELARGVADPWALALAAGTLLALGLKPIALADPDGKEGLSLLAVWIIIPLLGIWSVATILGVSLFAARYVLFIYPAVYYLWAWLLLRSKPANWLRFLPPCVFLTATVVFSLVPYAIENGVFRHITKNMGAGWNQAARMLLVAGRPGDLVVFYSGFIEADLFAESPSDTYLLSYVGWPLIAHLPPDHRFELLGLPLQQNARTDPYIDAIEEQAAKHGRVWVIGPDQPRSYFNHALISRFGFQAIATDSGNNDIKVSLLVRSRQ